jgi:twinfilin-like protein
LVRIRLLPRSAFLVPTKTLTELSASVRDAFITFATDASLLALSLKYSAGNLESVLTISYPEDPNASYQVALSQLEAVVNIKTPLYLILRRDHSLIAITYVPHLAPDELKNMYLDSRHELVQSLGGNHFALSLICKEAAEITDIRSWEERDMHVSECESNLQGEIKEQTIKDLGHQKNKCRLCDRRMKNNIEESASEALKMFNKGGDCVQLVRSRCAPNEPLITRLSPLICRVQR